MMTTTSFLSFQKIEEPTMAGIHQTFYDHQKIKAASSLK
jgi:hypothetical protein